MAVKYIRLYSRVSPSEVAHWPNGYRERVRDRVRVRVGLGTGNGLSFFFFFLSFSCLRCMVLNN